jgi:hypothetical protein
MYCNYCGSSNPDDSLYCCKCGQKLKSPFEHAKSEPIRPGAIDTTQTPAPEPFPRQYDRMDEDELTQLRDAYQSLRVPVPGDLQRGLEARAHSPKGGSRLATQANLFPTKQVPEHNATAAPAGATQNLPYNWGKFQGWVMMIAGPFVALQNSGWLAILTVPLTIATGYAFVRRKKFAVAMTYAWMIFIASISLLGVVDAFIRQRITPYEQGEEIGQAIGTLVIGLGFWSLCAMYYRKRRPEFT